MIKKNDFIKIDFTGSVKDGEVFDSTKKEELEKLHQGHDHPLEPKPFSFCVGHKMFMEAIEDFLIGKEIGKEYEIELSADKAFGARNPALVQKIPQAVFKNQKVNPMPGMAFNFDGKIGRILAVSGGRVMTDFNHPLAGKDVVYKVKIIGKVEDINEKIKALNDFFFRREVPFEIKEKRLILDLPENMENFAILFKEKYKEVLGLDLETKRTKKEGEEGQKTQ